MTHISDNKIGRFMVAVGAIIENAEGKILVLKRTDEFHRGTWELMYGRIDQFEDLDQALAREIKEETGLTEVRIKRLTRVWHLFRGEEIPEKELYGFTFHCQVSNTNVQLSSEHSEYRWVSPEEAYALVEIDGIKKEIKFFIDNKNNTKLVVTDKHGEPKLTFN